MKKPKKGKDSDGDVMPLPIPEESPGEINIEKLEREAAPEGSLEATSEEVGNTKSIVIMISIVVGLFVLFLVGSFAYNHLTAADVVNVDDLHKENLNNKLDESEGYIYNGYSFVKADGLWWTELNKFGGLLKVPLHFGPKEVEYIPLSGKLSPHFNEGEEMYIAIDPTVTNKYYSLAISELSFNVVKGMDRRPVGSCTKEDAICENRTTISCEHNPENKPVVELAMGTGERITATGSCIKITGNETGMVKAVDRMLYQWYGIIK